MPAGRHDTQHAFRPGCALIGSLSDGGRSLFTEFRFRGARGTQGTGITWLLSTNTGEGQTSENAILPASKYLPMKGN